MIYGSFTYILCEVGLVKILLNFSLVPHKRMIQRLVNYWIYVTMRFSKTDYLLRRYKKIKTSLQR